MLKFIDVLNAANAIIKARQRWNQQDGPNIIWQGALTKQISEDLDVSIRQSCDRTADADQDEVDEKGRELMLCLDDVARSHLKWMQDASMGLPTAPPRGSDQLHRVLDRLEVTIKTNDLPLPAPIEQLQKQGVSPNQIAIIYGWKTDDGAPDAQKVFDEIAKPGTHYKPKSWVHPALRAIKAEVDLRWSTREPRPKLFGHTTRKESEPLTAPPVPTLDELIELRAPVQQIMRLHDMSEADVLEAANAMGVELTERYVKPGSPAAALQERMTAEASA